MATTAGAVGAAAVGDGLAQLVWASGLESWMAALPPSLGGRYSGAIPAMADAFSAEPLDVAPETGVVRTLRFAAIVGGLAGVAGELWFRRLLLTFPGWTYDVALRTVFDQALFAPAVLALVVGGTTMLTTGDADYARQKLHHDCACALGKMWTWWLGGAMTSYLLVPTPWQPPFAFALAVGWSGFVSSRVHRPTARGSRAEEQTARMDAFLRDSRSREG